MNPRELVRIEGNRIVIDETELDLYSYPDVDVPEWKPKRELKPYSELSKIYLDIETTGLDPKKCQIVMIGLMNEQGKVQIIDCLNDEATGIRKFISTIRKKAPDLLIHFNGFYFDIPFLIERMKVHGIYNPFWVNPKPTVFSVAQKNGSPSVYNSIWMKVGEKQITVIDLYHQLLAWDFVARKLTKHTLKQAVLQIGLRKDARLELSFPEMMECIKSGELGKLAEYLRYDLEDTELLGNFLIPSIYYQKLFLPHWKLQSLSHSGNASKWNDILKTHYGDRRVVQSDTPKKFQGGLTAAHAGIYRNVSKIDVASLYPNLMLTYHLFPWKDTDNYMAGVLKYLLVYRLGLKQKKKEGIATSEEIRSEGAMKVMINSTYGSLGAQGIEYNDYIAAALVTAHGRAVLRLMMSTIEENGGRIVSCFTGDTVVVTDSGEFLIIDLIGKKVKVLNKKGNWSEVEFTKNSEAIRIWNVRLKRGKQIVDIRCTADHRWECYDAIDNFHSVMDTLELSEIKNKHRIKIPTNFAPRPQTDNSDYIDGVVHGIVYGDGSMSVWSKGDHHNHVLDVAHGHYRIGLVGEKRTLFRYFEESQKIINLRHRVDERRDDTENLFFSSTLELKKLPIQQNSNSYLLGFFRGLLATDGSVSGKDGCPDISGNEETCNFIRSIASRIGFNVTRQNISNKKGRTTIIKDKKCTQKIDTHRVFFEKSTMIYDDFLRTFHRDKFAENWNGYDQTPWCLISALPTRKREPVYCCNEPETHTFTLGHNILTKNCDTDGSIFSTDDPTFEKNKAIWKACQEVMPRGINLDYELEATIIYVPPASVKDNEDGKKKNYIYVTRDGKLKFKGVYSKRDRCVLENTFQPNMIKNLAVSTTAAFDYYQGVLAELRSGSYPLENLTITRKIRKGEKALVEAGIGVEGEIVSYWKGEDIPLYSEKTGKQLKKGKAGYTNTLAPDWDHYIRIVETQFKEIWQFVD
jgi:DNA polymerase elongation subunit (family B)